MAGKNAVLLGALGFGLLAVGAVAFFLVGGSPGGAPAGETPDAPVRPVETASAAPKGAAPVAPAPEAAPRGDGSIRGRLIRGMQKTPVPGEVRVGLPPGPPIAAPAGADGRFSLDGVPRLRPVTVHAESPGLLPVEVQVIIPVSGVFELGDVVLGGPVSLEVMVRDVGDRPVVGAAVSLHRTRPWGIGSTDWITRQFESRDPGAAAYSVVADEQGRSRFEAAAPGGWTVVVAAKGFAEDVSQVSLVEGAVREPHRVILGPAYALTGAILTRDGKPVPGAKVRGLRNNNWWNQGPRDCVCDSGPDGKYRLEGLARGTLGLQVEPVPGVRVSGGMVDIPSVTSFDIRVPGGCGLKGKILDDAAGTPIAGAEITVQTWSDFGGNQAFAKTVSGEDGAYALQGLPEGNLGTFGVRAKGYLTFPGPNSPGMMVQTRLRDGDSVEKDARLSKGAAVRGRVLDKEGKPVVGAMVRLKSFNPRMGIEDSPAAKSDAEGSWRIEPVPPSKGLLKVEAAGYYQKDWPAQEWQALQQGPLPDSIGVEVPAEGEVVKDLVLQATAAVEGVVVDKDGKSAPGITVSISPKGPKGGGGGPGALTDAEGKFKAVDVAPGEELIANAGGTGGTRGTSDPFRLDEGGSATGIRIALKAGATIAGRVRRDDGGPTQGATLRLVTGKRDANQPWNWDWQKLNAPIRPVGADGAFRAEGLYPGGYTLSCSLEGAAGSDGTFVEVAEGETKEGVEVVLGEEKKIAGKVLNPEGAPVAGASIKLKEVGGGRQQYWGGPDNDPVAATTDAAGAFSIRGLGKGPFTVTARASSFSDGVENNVEGGREDLVINLKAGLAIEGIVVDEVTGAPIPGITLYSNPKAPAAGEMQMRMPRSATSGKDGTFAIRDLASGSYMLSVMMNWNDASSDYSQKTVDNVDAGAKDVRVALAKGLPIAGKVVHEDGKPASGAYVQAIGKDANGNPDWQKQRGGQVNADGTFRLGGLPAGNYDLTINAGWGGGNAQGVAPTTMKGVSAGTEDLVVTVRKGLTITGKVVDEKGNPPSQPGNLQVTASGGAAPGGADNSWGNFGTDGAFTTQPLDPSKTYDLTVMGIQGYVGGTAKGITPGSKDVILTLRKGGSIAGTVVDDAGKSVGKGVPVMAMKDGGNAGEPGSWAQARTGDSGEFTLEGLGEFKFRLTAGGQNTEWRPSQAAETYESGATGVVLKTGPGATLSGKLVDARGVAIRTQWLRAVPEASDARSVQGGYARPAEDGTFTIKGLAPGKVKLSCMYGNKMVELGSFEAPGTDVTVTVPD
jgi:uncharacterized GH25 family protein